MKKIPGWKRPIARTEFSVTTEVIGDVRSGADPDEFFYPEIEPMRSGWIALDDVHQMYWEESGNPAGLPVIVLHGGPGAGTSPRHRRFFNPAHYHIIMCDQRGAGKSTPVGEIATNTTTHLISDIERLRVFLGIDKWLLFGGSWGSTLSLAYAETHRERCLGLLLRGVYFGEADEIDWHMHGLRRFAPQAWEDFVGNIPANERSNLLAAYAERLNNPDPAVHIPVALAWNRYETASSTLRPPGGQYQPLDASRSLALARIEAHYFCNRCFLREGQLFADIHTLTGLPCIIVHGRYDLLTPIRNAYRLHQALPTSTFVVVPEAGHSAFESPVARELIAAAERMIEMLS